MNWTADLTALESDAAAAAAEIDGLGAQLAARNEELTAATRDLEEQKRRVTELDAALVDERVHHAETQRVLVSARAEVAALRREQSHASVIDERIETLGALVADLSAMAPKRRGRPRASSRPGGD